MDTCKILIYDEQPLFREGVRQSVPLGVRISLFECGEESEALTLLKTAKPDIAVFSDDAAQFPFLRLITRLSYQTKPIVLSMQVNVSSAELAYRLGAKAFLNRRCTKFQLKNAIEIVMKNSVPVMNDPKGDILANLYNFSPLERINLMTLREREILRYIFLGTDTPYIASVLSLSHKTILNTCTSIKKKAGLNTKADLYRFAVDLGRAKALD